MIRNRFKNGHKICPQCSINKHESEYYKGGVYRMSWCKDCCKKNRPQDKDYFKKYYQNNKVDRLAKDRFRRYGVSKEKFDELFIIQDKKCALCRSDSPNGKGWCLDHDHNTNTIRQILCNTCNRALGFFYDNPELLLKAIDYIEFYRGTTL